MVSGRELLSGVRILDCTIWQAGPVAAAILGGLGAEVIKIEHPQRGDPARGMMGALGQREDVGGGRNFYFETININKKSMAFDLSKEEGKEILYRLVSKSDVFVHNLRRKTVKQIGLGYKTLRRYNPKLIYATGSGYARKGPDADLPAVDSLAMARSGFMFGVGEPGMPPLYQYAGGIADQTSATLLAFGIVAALYGLKRSGIVQEVGSSLLGGIVWAQSLGINRALWLGQGQARIKRTTASPLFNTYKCKDGEWVCLAILQSDRHWPVVCKALGREDLIDDSRFKNLELRSNNREELIQILDGIFATRSQDDWSECFREWDLLAAPIRTYTTAAKDPVLRENNYVIRSNHPVLGEVETVGWPVYLSRTPWRVKSHAPAFGEHTEEILLEVGGYSWEEISVLKEKGVIP